MNATPEALRPIVTGRPAPAAGGALFYSALALVFLVLYGAIEWRLRLLGAFTVNDLLFDADPGTRLRGIAHGWERLLLIHPLFPYAFTIPIRVVAKVWMMVAGYGGGEQALRELIAMVVAPVCGAATVALMARVMLAAGISRAGAAVCATGFGLSFSTLIFASIPDHFIVSNLLAVAALGLCTVAGSDRITRWPGVLWWPLGVAATGVTISNVAIPACAFFAARYRALRAFWAPARETVAYASVVLAVTAVVGVAGAAATGEMEKLLPQEMGGSGSESMLLRYLASNPLARAARAPKALADSLAPRELALAPPGDGDKTDTPVPHLSLETGARWLGIPLVVVGLLAAAIVGHRQADKGFSAPVMAALAILGGNVAFHAVFGKEYFLYSQHWMAALWLTLAGLWRLRGWREPFGSVAAILAIAAMAFLNYGTLLEVFDQVSRAGLTPGSR